jgi:hypothetical protein
MKILFEVKEIAKAKHGSAVAQRVTLEPVSDPGDDSVDGYAARQLQVVITNPADFLPATVNPGEVVSISLRVYDPADE